MPIGGYLVIHLLTNATTPQRRAGIFKWQVGSDPFAGLRAAGRGMVVHFLAAAVPCLRRLADHQRSDAQHQFLSLRRNIRYVLQRPPASSPSSSSSITCWKCITWASEKFNPEHAASSAAKAIDRALWVQVVYAMGILSCVYHLGQRHLDLGASPGASGPPRGPAQGELCRRRFRPRSGRRRSERSVGCEHGSMSTQARRNRRPDAARPRSLSTAMEPRCEVDVLIEDDVPDSDRADSEQQ